MSAAPDEPSVHMGVSTCWAPSAVCVIQALNWVLMANSAIVSRVNQVNQLQTQANIEQHLFWQCHIQQDFIIFVLKHNQMMRT